jgi:hypothetical protein
MTTRFLIAASLLALAACGIGSVSLQAGEWEMRKELVSLDAPELSPAMKTLMSLPVTDRRCISEEEAKGLKPENMAALATANDCKQEEYVWSYGRIHSKMSCGGAQSIATVSVAMEGSYTPVSLDVNVKTETRIGGSRTTYESRITGRRIGPCRSGLAG